MVEVALDPDEQEAYRTFRAEYLAFARRSGVDFKADDGWARFIAY